MLEPTFVRELRERADGLEPDVLFLAREHWQHRVDHLVVAEPAERAYHDRHRLRGRRLEHFDQAGHRALAADLRERIHGALADPPVLVLGGFDEVTDRAVVLRLVEDLHRGAADVLVLVADELQHGVDHFRAADLAECIRGARTNPPVVVRHRFEQLLHRLRGAHFVEHFDRGPARIFVFVL